MGSSSRVDGGLVRWRGLYGPAPRCRPLPVRRGGLCAEMSRFTEVALIVGGVSWRLGPRVRWGQDRIVFRIERRRLPPGFHPPPGGKAAVQSNNMTWYGC